MTSNEPTTLAALQDLTTEELRAVAQYQYHGTLSPKRLIQGIVRLANAEVSWQGEENAESLRGFWYNPVKPIVETAFPTKRADPSYRFGRRMSQCLSGTLSEMVKNGAITYRDLNILDDSRQREIQCTGLESDKILFVEKDAAYRKLKPLADVYELSIVSGSGWQATALIEDIARDLDPNTSYHLFIVSDFDPTGFRIAEDFHRRSARLGIKVASVERVAITPEQMDENTRRIQRFTPPVSNTYDERWMKTHGIEGEFGLEIEAVGGLETGGRVLRELVADALKPHMRERERYAADINAEMSFAADEVVDTVLNEITADLRSELRDAVADTLGEREHVRSVEYDEYDGFRISIDLDGMIHNGDNDGSEDAYLPSRIRPGMLHESAAEGTTVSYDVKSTRHALRRELRRRLTAGEIDVAARLDDEF